VVAVVAERGGDMARDYKREYANFHSKPEEMKKRASRNKANRIMKKKGLIRKGDGKHVDHKDGNPRNNHPKNLQVISASHNMAKH
jgi:hypothetical protein